MPQSHLYEQREELFTHVVEQLSMHQNLNETLPNILEKTCRFFSFGCGFIYETEHTGILIRKEYIETQANMNIPIKINLEKILTKEQMIELCSEYVFTDIESELYINQPIGRCFCSLFDAHVVLIIPFVNKESRLVGITGIIKKHAASDLSEKDLSVARSVLMVIANHVQLRVSRQLLKNARNSLSFTLDNTGVDIYVNDFYTHEILYVNKTMAAPYGGVEKLMGKKCYEVLYNDKNKECNYCPQKKLIDANGQPTKLYSWDYQRPFDGSWFRVFSAAFRWVDGRIAHVVSSVDITESKKYEFLVEQMAFYDALTNIPNRRKFDKDFENLISSQSEEDMKGYLLFVDLDNFKYINDVYGHELGDELLRQIAYYLDNEPFARGRVYRYGGDEFILFFHRIEEHELKNIVSMICKRFEHPWNLKKFNYLCTCSIGVSNYPQDGKDSSSLIHTADTAMYQAKRSGKGHAEYYKDIM